MLPDHGWSTGFLIHLLFLGNNSFWVWTWYIDLVWLWLYSFSTGENDYKIADFLKRCRSQEGGYGGGPGQQAHLAATYAAVNALVCVGGNICLESIDRVAIRKFLALMQKSDGSFSLHTDGEVDIR